MGAEADRVFLDTNVVLDHLADRQPFAELAHRIFALAESGRLKLHISALSICILYYLLRKSEGHGRAITLLAKLALLAQVTAVGDREIRGALGSGMNDFEDAVQLESADSMECLDTLITRNPRDYSTGRMRVLSPADIWLHGVIVTNEQPRVSKSVLITGVSRGLGLAIARRLLEGGWTVCGTSRTESAEWRMLAAKHEGRAEWVKCDLSAPADVDAALFSEWLPVKRPLHAFVNNAATAYDDLITNLRVPRLEEMFATSVITPMAITRAVIRNMLFHSTRGAIVHVSSISVHAGAKGLAMYAATKGALEAFSRNTAREWGERGIRSNCVVPGYMDTEMTATLTDEQKAKIHRRAALKQPTDVESVAATVGFLLSDDAGSITGQNIFVDGGMI